MLREISFSRAGAVLAGVLVAAFAVRIYGIWFGLPYLFHIDEGFEVRRALQLGAGSFNFERTGKGLYFYLLFVEYGFLFVFLKLTGAIESAKEFGALYFRDPTAFYLLGRATSAVLGTLTVYLSYLVGRRAFGVTAGVMAAAFLAVNIIHARVSHLILVDVPMTLFIVASLYFALRIARDASTRDYIWAAVLAALAVSAKLPAVTVLVPLLIAHFFVMRDSSAGWSRTLFGREILMSGGLFLLVYVVTNPGIVFYFDDLLLGMLGRFVPADTDADAVAAAVQTVERPNLFVWYGVALAESMTWPLFLVFIGGVGLSVLRRTRADIILLSFFAVYFVLLASADQFQNDRYLMPLTPMAALFAGRILAEASRLASMPAIVGLCFVLVAWPAFTVAAHSYYIAQKDTRAYAKEWIDENIPAGSRILIEGLNGRVSQATVPLQKSYAQTQRLIEEFEKSDPPKATYFRMELAAHDPAEPGYDLVLVNPVNLRDLQYYTQQGVRYFVVRPDVFLSERKEEKTVRGSFSELLAEIRQDPDIVLLERFEPNPRTRPHFLIEVYGPGGAAGGPAESAGSDQFGR